jgi:DNA end-binding protein Ku
MASRKKTKHPKPKASNDNRRKGAGGRPAWQGHLRLSLVSCPVALINAVTSAEDISFHLINPETNNRIKMVTTDPETGPVDRSSLVKGYEISKGSYVIVTPEELQEVKLETTRTLDIERFVDASSIDRLYWDNPYFLVPDGKMGVAPYNVIQQAMVKSQQIALGRVVMHTRERLVAIEPRGKGLVAYTMRMANEVRDPDKVFADLTHTRPDKQLIEIAQKIIEQQHGKFDPAHFKDRYEKALIDLIKRKRAGKKPLKVEEPEATNVIDLMDALRKSLSHRKSAGSHKRKKAS